MTQLAVITLIGSIIVILFDTLASLISRRLQIRYYLFSGGSFLIYAIVGFVAFKYSNLLSATLTAGFTGLIESTLGWYISWIIGPGRPEIEMNLTSKFQTVIFVIITALFFGLIGSLASNLV